MANLLLNWTASTDNVAVTGYYLLINGVVVDVGDTTDYVLEVDDFEGYQFYVRAYDAAGNRSPWTGPIGASQRVIDGGEQVTDGGEIVFGD